MKNSSVKFLMYHKVKIFYINKVEDYGGEQDIGAQREQFVFCVNVKGLSFVSK